MSIFEERSGGFTEKHPDYGNCAVNIGRPRKERAMITAFWGEQKEKNVFESVLSDFASECWQDGKGTEVILCPVKSAICAAEETVQLDFDGNDAILLNAIISFENSDLDKILGDIFDVARDFGAKKNYRVQINLYCLLESDATNKRAKLESVSQIVEANRKIKTFIYLFRVRGEDDAARAYNAISRLIVLSNTGREETVGRKNFMYDFSYSEGYTTEDIKFFTVGFCDASIDIKSLYLTGFDEFSDSVINKLKNDNGLPAPDSSFCFTEATEYIDQIVTKYTTEALANSRYLLKEKFYVDTDSITVEEYSGKFCNGLLERYYNVNAAKAIKSIENYINNLERKIEEEMIDYIIKYGLDNAVICVDKLKETVLNYGLKNVADYSVQAHNEEEMLKFAFNLYGGRLKYRFMQDVISIYRKILGNDGNKVYRVEGIVDRISQATEAKKQELADGRSLATQKVVEDVKRAAEQIKPLNREQILGRFFDKDDYDDSLCHIFDYFDGNIVDNLIGKNICYADNFDINNSDQVSRYCQYLDDSAVLSVPISVGLDDREYLFYAAIVDSCGFNSHLLESLREIGKKEPMVAAVGGDKRRFTVVKIKGIKDVGRINGLN